MRRLAGLGAAVALLVGCAADTEPATEVGYSVATLEAKGHCDKGDSGSWRFQYRRVGTQPWTDGPTHPLPAACAQGRVPASGEARLADQVQGLTPGASYEYRFAYGGGWADSSGATNGTNYDRLTTQQAPMTGAHSTRSFGNTLGVNTRTGFLANDTSWHQPHKDALDYLGVVGIRDGLHGPTPDFHQSQRQFFRLVAQAGYKITLGMGSLEHRDQVPQKIQSVIDDPVLRSGVVSIESTNESDFYEPWVHCPGASDPWYACLRWYQQDLATRVRNAPALASLPLVGPSYVGAAWNEVGSLDQWVDIGNMHPYPGGGKPGPAAQENFDNCYQTVNRPKPCQATEVGYHTGWQVQGHDGVPPDVRAAYTLRLLLEHNRIGYSRTDLWSLIDGCGESPTAHDFGLFNCDWAPRHVARALHNFTRVLDTAAAAVGPTIVRLGFDGAPDDLRHLVLRHPDGSFRVVLWRDVSIWDRNSRQRLTPAPDNLEVGWSGPRATVEVYDPLVSDQPQRIITGSRINVDVAGGPVVLKLR